MVVAAIRQLHRLAKGMFRSSHGHKDQQQISDLQKQHDMLRLVSATLSYHLALRVGEELVASYPTRPAWIQG